MEVIPQILLLIVGFVLLIKGADFFVDGASSTASNFKVPKILIGLTIIAFGTSAPELAVSIKALASGNTDMVLGNVIGSNILNILLILGIAATDRDTTLLRLHAVGIVIAIARQLDQFAVVAEALFEQRHGGIQVGHILRPLIAQHLGRRLHLPTEGIGKGSVATHIILHTR